MPEQNLNPDAVEAGAKALFLRERKYHEMTNEHNEPPNWEDLTEISWEYYRGNARAVLSALPTEPELVNSVMEDFINDRPGYITALKNTTGDDSMGDYWRWSGHAEARRQLAEKLGWTVPHDPGETTKPVEG